MSNSPSMTLYHFPGCPYSERVEIVLELKGLGDAVRDVEVDMSAPRPQWLLQKTRGTTALPAFETPEGTLKESLVIMRYLEQRFPERPVANPDPFRHAVEGMLVATDGAFAGPGYQMIRNQDPARRAELRAAVDAQYARLDAFLRDWGSGDPWLFDAFGWAEAAFTPLLKRMEFLPYYEDYAIPPGLGRVQAWRDACLAHPAARHRTVEEVVKLYYDYSRGIGGGSLPPGRQVSSFTLEPNWRARPMPPRDKWGRPGATDAELGLA